MISLHRASGIGVPPGELPDVLRRCTLTAGSVGACAQFCHAGASLGVARAADHCQISFGARHYILDHAAISLRLWSAPRRRAIQSRMHTVSTPVLAGRRRPPCRSRQYAGVCPALERPSAQQPRIARGNERLLAARHKHLYLGEYRLRHVRKANAGAIMAYCSDMRPPANYAEMGVTES